MLPVSSVTYVPDHSDHVRPRDVGDRIAIGVRAWGMWMTTRESPLRWKVSPSSKVTTGSALSFVQTLPQGVYVAMNGRWFPWDDVRKNKELAVFEAISGG